MKSDWYEAIFFLVFLAGFLVFAFISNRSRSKKLKAFEKEFSGKCVSFPLSGFKGKYLNTQFKMVFVPASRNSPPFWQIYLYKKPTGSFLIRRQAKYYSVLRSFGILKEVKTRDPEFDKDFIVLSSQKRALLSLFSNIQIKQAVRDIFSSGFSQIKAKNEFFISKRGYKFDEDVTVERVKYILDRLIIIARGY